VPARTGNGDAVEQLEKVEIQAAENCGGGALFRRQGGPDIECCLGTAEDAVDVLSRAQLAVERVTVAFVGQRQLVFQVVEAIIDWGRREHQHLGFDALADHLVHQPLIAGFPVLVDVVVAEVVRLVDHHQVVVAPIDAIQRNAQ
jgi:hypothetical protein